jgi:uncharacterized membrane protein YccC
MSRAALLDVLRADARELLRDVAGINGMRPGHRTEVLEYAARAARLYLLARDVRARSIKGDAEDCLRAALATLRRAP